MINFPYTGNKELVTVDQQSLLTLQKTTTKAQKIYKWSYGGQTGTQTETTNSILFSSSSSSSSS